MKESAVNDFLAAKARGLRLSVVVTVDEVKVAESADPNLRLLVIGREARVGHETVLSSFYFDSSQKNALAHLNRGDLIRVSGEISNARLSSDRNPSWLIDSIHCGIEK